MDIKTRQKDNVYILDLEGEIHLYNVQEFKNKVQELMDASNYNILINLEKVTYIDSSGIGALISTLSKLKKYHGSLKLVHVYASIKRVFELTKLTSFFEIYENEEDAIAKFV